MIEIDEVPAEGLIGRYQLFLGERPTTIYRSTPCNAVPAYDPAESADDGDDPAGAYSSSRSRCTGQRESNPDVRPNYPARGARNSSR